MTTVLVTGGAGFIGTHTCAELLERGRDVVVIDDYSNSTPAALEAVQTLTGRSVTACQCDMRDRKAVDAVFDAHRPDGVIHFAAKKAVGESVRIPVDYYDINVTGTINLLHAMLAHNVHKLVFSSSCSIYGDQFDRPIREDDPSAPTNPYARSKAICEQILADTCAQYSELSVAALRYFNPVGAHPSGVIGEVPRGNLNNVMPYLLQVACRRLPRLQIFGGDYPTRDGTGVRDYIHVVDVASAHLLALDHLDDGPGLLIRNLGTGTGVSVLELLGEVEKASGVTIPYEIVDRRPGDVATLVADPSRVADEWGWRTTRDLFAMCEDAWRFQQKHPDGYER